MKQIVILSGKGGTGKTTVAAALADLAAAEGSIILADADVDAANLELVLSPTRLEATPFSGGETAVIDASACTACDRCAEVCRFEAVRTSDDSSWPPLSRGGGGIAYRVDPLACEGCAACYYQCPVEAIRMVPAQAGEWYRSETPYGPLFHAHLFAGQENSGKLVTMVRQQARLLALEREPDWLLVDGPPGIGCPVIAACAGADLALLVTEPTLSGIHDLERALATVQHFGVRAVICVNKADINRRRAAELVADCRARGIPVVGEIPFDLEVTRAMTQGLPVTRVAGSAAGAEVRRVWEKVKEALSG
ncbi:MAG: 4Fe-4S binding protein [Chloroflexi bacterium]|nr:4Fe-4S binding protein [Chloroflexota bacterium]